MNFGDLYILYYDLIEPALAEARDSAIDTGYLMGGFSGANPQGQPEQTYDGSYYWWSEGATIALINLNGDDDFANAVAMLMGNILTIGIDSALGMSWQIELPSQVATVEVVGQRRLPGSNEPFPLIDWASWPGASPCSHPELRLGWNMDAAAAEALEAILQKAEEIDGTRDLSEREYGTLLCEHADGSVTVASTVYYGDTILDENGVPRPIQPTVHIPFNSCGTSATIIAMIHSHPGTGNSGGLPSTADSTWINSIIGTRGDTAGGIYVISRDSAGQDYRMNFYNQINIASGVNQGILGPEVNPYAQPC